MRLMRLAGKYAQVTNNPELDGCIKCHAPPSSMRALQPLPSFEHAVLA